MTLIDRRRRREQGQHVVAQRCNGSPKSPLKTPHLPGPALDGARARSQASPFLLMHEVAAYLRFSGPRNAEKALRFCRVHGVQLLRRGRVYLVRQDSIDRVLDGQPSDLEVVAAAIASTDRSRHLKVAHG